uniref:Uncharacterized protein n=1 Tax=Caenorhabditis japonica TaxID=281687 RepID=A0A8R1DRN1_CAEJA
MELNPDSEEIWFGIVYFVLSAPQVPLTLLVIISVYRKNQEGSNLTYKLVNVINFTQFVQSTGHLLTAPILIWPALQKMPPVVLQAVGCAMIIFFEAELMTMALLAVCRILIFKKFLKNTKTSIWIKFIFLLGALFLLFAYITGVITGYWTFVLPVWTFNYNVHCAKYMAILFATMNLISFFITYTCYITIVFIIYVKKRKITSAPKRRDEIAIASQYTFITVYATITLAFWNLSNYRPDNASKSVRAIMNICWQVGIYINPILLLILNRLNF